MTLPSAKDIEKKFKEKYGEQIGGAGVQLPKMERCPTGFFLFDLSLGGGIPKGVCSIIFGPESAGKSTLALKTIAEHQRRWPHETCHLFDMETSYDPEWAAKLGVDVDALHVYRPEYAEMAVDMVEAMLAADDTGLVVLDSIAAMTTTAEIDGDASSAQYGGASRVVSKMVRKVNTQLNLASKAGRMPAVVYINQIRTKIGVMYGSPEDMPGGNALKFQSSLTVRLWGKPSKETTANKALPLFREVESMVKKHKVQIVATHAKWKVALVPTKGLAIGEADDFNTMKDLMRQYGVLGQDSKHYILDGGEYKTLKDVRAALMDDPVLMDEVRTILVNKITAEMTGTVIGNVVDEVTE